MKIYIGIPCLGEINSYLVEQLFKVVNNYKDITFVLDCNVKQPTDVNRNIIVDNFLKTDCEWLWLIDSDMTINPNLDNILKDLTDGDKKIVSALNFIWQSCLKSNIFYLDNGVVKTKTVPDEPDTFEVWNSGCGCIFINKEVFSKVDKPYFNFHKINDGIECLSENLLFLERCKNVGYKIFLNPLFVTGHLKLIDLNVVNTECMKWLEYGKRINTCDGGKK